VLTFNREMNGRWFALAAAVGLLYIGIDRTFFDRIVGSGPLARIERILTILAGTLLITLSIGLFAAAWKGRSVTAMNTNSIKGKVCGLRSFLYGVSLTDPWAYAALAVVLSVIALSAAWIPARRACRVDPMIALRFE